MLRYNQTYQQRADAFIREDEASAFALYVGHYHGVLKVGEDSHDWLAFLPMHADSRIYEDGLPQYILVDDDETIWAIDGFDVMHKTYRFDNLVKGRRLYRELEHKWQTNTLAQTDNPDFICQLMQLTHNYPEPLIPLQDAYLFLQEAHRLNRSLSLVSVADDKRVYCLDQDDHIVEMQDYYIKME